MERVKTIDQIQHPIIGEALRLTHIETPHLEINSLADIPAGTGLGSSGSFTTALLKALHIMRRMLFIARSPDRACRIEIDILGEPIGKQDQSLLLSGDLPASDLIRTIPWRHSRLKSAKIFCSA